MALDVHPRIEAAQRRADQRVEHASAVVVQGRLAGVEQDLLARLHGREFALALGRRDLGRGGSAATAASTSTKPAGKIERILATICSPRATGTAPARRCSCRGTAISADVLGFDTAGAAFTVSGTSANLQSGGQTFATYTHTGGVLTISFTSSGTAATTALVNNVAQHITYGNNTPAGDATLRFTLNYGIRCRCGGDQRRHLRHQCH